MSTFFVILHDADPANEEGRERLRENLESKLGLRPERIAQIFSSLPVILKEQMKEADADSYVRVLERLGASVEKLPENSSASTVVEQSSLAAESVVEESAEEASSSSDAYELDMNADYSLEDLEGILDQALAADGEDSSGKDSSGEDSSELEFSFTETTDSIHTGPDKPVEQNDLPDDVDEFAGLELAPEPQVEESKLDQQLMTELSDSTASAEEEGATLEVSTPDTNVLDDAKNASEFVSAAETLSNLSKSFEEDTELDDGESLENELLARLESGEAEENRISAEELGEELNGELKAPAEEAPKSESEQEAVKEDAKQLSDSQIQRTSSSSGSTLSESASNQLAQAGAENEPEESAAAQLISRATVWVGVAVVVLGLATLVLKPEFLTGATENEGSVRFDPAPGMLEALLKQQAEILGRSSADAGSLKSETPAPQVRRWAAVVNVGEADFSYSANLLTVNTSPAFMQFEASTRKPEELTAEELVAGVSRPWLQKISAPNIKIDTTAESDPENMTAFLEGSARGYLSDRGHRGRVLLQVKAKLSLAKDAQVKGFIELRHGNVSEKLKEHKGDDTVFYVARADTESFLVLIRAPITAILEGAEIVTEEEKQTEKTTDKSAIGAHGE